MAVHLLGVDKQVFRLDVSVDHVVSVAVLDRLQQLVNVVAHLV